MKNVELYNAALARKLQTPLFFIFPVNIFVRGLFLWSWKAASLWIFVRLVAHSVNLEPLVIMTFQLLLMSFCLFVFCLSCNYGKLERIVTGPNECLHFILFMSHFGGG